MKSVFRMLVKLLVMVGIFIIALLTGGYLWVKSAWTDIYTEKQLNQYIYEITQAQPVPDNFKTTLAIIYPGILEKGLTEHLIYQGLSDKDYGFCPCRAASSLLRSYNSNAGTGLRIFYSVSFTWAIEERVTQEQCLAYYLNRFDFTRGVIGISDASNCFFNEELKNLNTDQQLELILKLKNPLFYVKTKNPKLFETEMKKFKDKFKVNSGI